MDLNIEEKNNVTIISFDGRLDSNTSPEVQNEVIPMLSPGMKIVLDMENCDYLSSAGLRVLMMIGKILSKKDGKGVFLKLSQDLKDIMEMTGFGDIFENFEELGQAIQAVKEKNEKS